MKWTSAGFGIFLFLVIPSSTYAIDTYGSLTFRSEGYVRDNESCGECEQLGLSGKLDLNADFREDKKWTIHLNPILQVDNQGYGKGFFSEWRNEDRHESYAYLRQGFILFSPSDRLEIGTGIKIFYWGLSEEINPTNFNPKRYLDIIEVKELGLPAAWTKLQLTDESYFEIVLSKSGTSLLPWDEDNRWRPPQIEGIEIYDPHVPDQPQIAFRLGGTWQLFDASLIYFHGVKDVPQFELDSPQSFRTDYFQTDMLGANVGFDIFGWFGLKGETAFRYQDKQQDDYLQWAIVADKLFSWERSSLLILFQYVKENVTDEGSNPYQALDLSRAIKNAIMTKIEYKHGDWGASFKGAYDLDKEGYFFQPKISRIWFEHYNVSIGFDFLGGPSNSFFGTYHQNERVFAEIAYQF